MQDNELHWGAIIFLLLIVLYHVFIPKQVQAGHIELATAECEQNGGIKYVEYNNMAYHTVTCVNGGEFTLMLTNKVR
jgi:hypothetical protein